MRILIANRGEIARRIIRTADRMGHETVAAYAAPDSSAPFVAEATTAALLGPADLAESYLSISRLLAVAEETRADAVHPGYGFLSESADFAAAVVSAGLIWIGPHAEATARMGSKIEARRLAGAAGLPVIPGFDGSQHADDLRTAAGEIGYPVLIKAAAGGGGKGIRIVEHPDNFDTQLEAARTESRRAFDDDDVIVERYIVRPRHVEVQVVGDKHGAVVELGTRECSVQRRYQKLLEEAPAPNLPDATRQGLRDAAAGLAAAIGYDSAGTVEFVVDDDTGDFFFLEMNTRLQVEHPVTEAITGLDLVEMMIDSAAGVGLAVSQDEVSFRGHAIEARINAEDPSAGFVPQTGEVTHLAVPSGVRWDSGVESGSEITPHYDSMIAKLIVHGADRVVALERLRTALDALVVGGLPTTAGLHRWLIDQPPIVEGRVTTRFLDEVVLPEPPGPEAAAAIAAQRWVGARPPVPDSTAWADLGSLRFTPHSVAPPILLRDGSGNHHEVLVGADHGVPAARTVVDLDRRSVAVNLAGYTHTFEIQTRSEAWAPSTEIGHGHAGALLAPFPAVVTEVLVEPGDHVPGGQVLVVLEAMKMLHSLPANGPGVVAEVRVVPGDQVVSAQVLITFEDGGATGRTGEDQT